MATKVQQKAFDLAEQQAIALRNLGRALMQFHGWDRNCLNCFHWNSSGSAHPETCSLAKNQRPPATVIVKGCGEWEEDQIPF